MAKYILLLLLSSSDDEEEDGANDPGKNGQNESFAKFNDAQNRKLPRPPSVFDAISSHAFATFNAPVTSARCISTEQLNLFPLKTICGPKCDKRVGNLPKEQNPILYLSNNTFNDVKISFLISLFFLRTMIISK